MNFQFLKECISAISAPGLASSLPWRILIAAASIEFIFSQHPLAVSSRNSHFANVQRLVRALPINWLIALQKLQYNYNVV